LKVETLVTAFTRQRSLVRSQHRPLEKEVHLQVKSANKIGMLNSQWTLVLQLCSNAEALLQS